MHTSDLSNGETDLVILAYRPGPLEIPNGSVTQKRILDPFRTNTPFSAGPIID